jgi:hypothetical protein
MDILIVSAYTHFLSGQRNMVNHDAWRFVKVADWFLSGCPDEDKRIETDITIRDMMLSGI